MRNNNLHIYKKSIIKTDSISLPIIVLETTIFVVQISIRYSIKTYKPMLSFQIKKPH